MKRALFACVIILCLFSCRKITPDTEKEAPEQLSSYIQPKSSYVTDESLDFFLSYPWYAYDEGNHIIWPNLRVYSLKANSTYYKVQVIDYYNEAAMPGHDTLRVQKDNGRNFLWNFEAEGCGNVYTNLSYKECLKNPEQNIYTYLDFKTKKAWKMTELEALSDDRWDLAFNGTEVKMNAGDSGPGDTRMAELYFYGGFSNGESADFQRIAEVSFSDKGERFFNLDLSLRAVSFALPPGIPRVVYEPDWFGQEAGTNFHRSVPENWWF